MDLGLGNRTALVLGAGGGLGSAIAATLAGEGAKVAVADLDRGAAGRTVDTISQGGGRAIALEWDLANLDLIDRNVSTIETELGGVDILVSITGGPPPGGVLGQSPDLWRKHFEAMVLSVFAITDRVVPGMRERGWGRIITSTSSGVVAPIPNLGLSNALRSTLLGWSKTLAGEVGRDGVTANIVLPGRIATERITYLDRNKAEREGRAIEDVVAQSTGSIALGRYGDPQEYADVVAFLASERAAYVTGSVVRIDGGYIPSI
ncbi:SDR family oxidoreductase [Fulvimarina endophytica]|uniref:SDR family oxidoreductase n=1 Tax=Fulvimarina endophytica TaxID=2293836 RepID=A0A371X1M9_9HYPH|nr:SDR family oxidoreductase [Fulvimarina endophytica]RFC63150.1 SDR family oxidoreductase [Fulvimarina endophytica]